MTKLLLLFTTFSVLSATHGKNYLGVVTDQMDFKKAELNGPQGSYKKLIEWHNPMDDFYYCYIYKTPYHGELGTLSLRKSKKKNCPLGDDILEKVIREEVISLKVLESSDELGLKYQFLIKNKKSEDILGVRFPLSESEQKRWPLISLTQKNIEKTTASPKKKGELCHSWNINCEEAMTFECGSCENGLWSQSLNYKICPQKPVAYCGLSQCGGRGQPACLKMTSLKEQLTCEEALAFVACSPGTNPYCQGTGEIICR